LTCGIWLVIAIKDVNQTREKQDTNHTHYGANDQQQDSRSFHAGVSPCIRGCYESKNNYRKLVPVWRIGAILMAIQRQVRSQWRIRRDRASVSAAKLSTVKFSPAIALFLTLENFGSD
jgi:hypothetical protein